MIHRRNPDEKLKSKLCNIWLKTSSVVPHGTIFSAVWCGHHNNLVMDRSAWRNMNGIWLASSHSVWMTLQEPYANLHIFSSSTSISLLWCSLCTFNGWIHRFSTGFVLIQCWYVYKQCYLDPDLPTFLLHRQPGCCCFNYYYLSILCMQYWCLWCFIFFCQFVTT